MQLVIIYPGRKVHNVINDIIEYAMYTLQGVWHHHGALGFPISIRGSLLWFLKIEKKSIKLKCIIGIS